MRKSAEEKHDEKLMEDLSSEAEKVKAKLLSQRPPERVDWTTGLSSGSTLLNLACSGRKDVAFLRGGEYLFVGDSSSGKTFLTLTCLAEACRNPLYTDYQLVYDAVERGALMDFDRFFGKTMVERLMPPAGTKEEPEYSSSLESMYYHLYDVLEKGPCIYILDSMDALFTDDETTKFEEAKAAYEKGKEVAGSYGTSKAKLNSSHIRVIFNKLAETGSIFIIISQTRSNIGFGSQFKKTRSGGLALTFYANLEIWSSVKGHVKKNYKGKDRELGINCLLHVKKNRLTGRDRKVEVPILHSVGIDDTASLVDYLVEEGIWKESKGKVTPDEKDNVFGAMGTEKKENLIETIQEDGMEEALRDLAEKTWNDLENNIKVKRRPRYE